MALRDAVDHALGLHRPVPHLRHLRSRVGLADPTGVALHPSTLGQLGVLVLLVSGGDPALDGQHAPATPRPAPASDAPPITPARVTLGTSRAVCIMCAAVPTSLAGLAIRSRKTDLGGVACTTDRTTDRSQPGDLVVMPGRSPSRRRLLAVECRLACSWWKVTRPGRCYACRGCHAGLLGFFSCPLRPWDLIAPLRVVLAGLLVDVGTALALDALADPGLEAWANLVLDDVLTDLGPAECPDPGPSASPAAVTAPGTPCARRAVGCPGRRADGGTDPGRTAQRLAVGVRGRAGADHPHVRPDVVPGRLGPGLARVRQPLALEVAVRVVLVRLWYAIDPGVYAGPVLQPSPSACGGGRCPRRWPARLPLHQRRPSRRVTWAGPCRTPSRPSTPWPRPPTPSVRW